MAAHGVGGADPTDVERPNFARMMNHLLGGAANFAADREAVEVLLHVDATAGERARASRAFLLRALRAALGRGHDQFLDLGAGIPSVGGVHTIVQAVRPDARVAYVDNDPVAVAHTRDLLAGTKDVGTVAVSQVDLLDVRAVLGDPDVAGMLDLTRPVTVVCTSVLQWIQEDVREAFALYRDALAPGSLVVLSHVYGDRAAPGVDVDAALPVVAQVVGPIRLREPDELRTVFAGWDLLEPGIVDAVDWPVATGRPRSGFWGLVAAVG